MDDFKKDLEELKQRMDQLGQIALLIGQQNIIPGAVKPRHLVPSQAKGDIDYSTGTDFARLAIGSSTQLLTISGGLPAWVSRLPTYQASPGDPSGTTSLTGVMMGLAGTITPTVTGKVLISLTGTIANATAIGDGANVQLRTGTGTAPANADALTGTTAGGLVKYVAATTAQKSPFALTAIVSGLTVGTALWIDVGLAAVTAGTATIKDLSLTCFEL